MPLFRGRGFGMRFCDNRVATGDTNDASGDKPFVQHFTLGDCESLLQQRLADSLTCELPHLLLASNIRSTAG